MRIGVNLPSDSPEASCELLLEWARRAEQGPFSTLGVTDRIAWATLEPFATLAAAGAVTRRIRLMTAIAIAPLRGGALLAKSAATVDALSGGRLTLGLGIGPREDDYAAAGIDFRSRGRRFDAILEELRPSFEGSRGVGPRSACTRGPQIAIGGLSDHAFARLARYGDGYVHGGGPPKAFARAAEKARAAWADAGRPGMPHLFGQGYFALGSRDAIDRGARSLGAYYGFLGPFAERITAGLLTSPHAVAQYARSVADAGCDELLLLPTVPELDQLERLADAVANVGFATEAAGAAP